MSEQYFAINPTVDELNKRIDEYFEALAATSWDSMIAKSYSYYYGRGQNGTSYKISPSGEQGELSEMMANEYRSFLRYMLTLITSERPAFDVRSMNTDYKSASQAVVGEQVLEFYLRHKKLENLLKDACEKSLWSGEGFIGLRWDVTAGETHSLDEESNLIMKGDVEYSAYNALQVIRDPFSASQDPDWVIIVDYKNKWDLVAQYPEAEEDLINISLNAYRQQIMHGIPQGIKTNKVPVFTFYHKKSAALPEGRWVYFAGDRILAEGPLPYEEIPVYRVAPGNVENFVFGYTPGFDILGLQEANDDIFSALLTNNRNHSRQLIAVKKDAGVNYRQLTEGASVLELDVEDINNAVKPIQLTASSPESYTFLENVVSRMEKYTGINEVIRGEPSPNLRSGNALALIAAQSVKFNSGLQQSYNMLLEDVGTATLRFLKQFAKAPRFFRVVGTTNRSLLSEFSSEDLEGVDRVDVQKASALTSTTAGRIEIADNMMQGGLIKRPEQYINVLETGRLDPLIEAERSELLNIKSENELMQNAEAPVAILTDNHMLHIREHKAVLDDPTARRDPAVVQAVLAHLEEHRTLWQQTPPEFLMASGQQPAPQMPPPPGQDPNAQPTGGANPDALAAKGPGDQVETPGLPSLPPEADPNDVAAYQQLNLPPV